MSHRKVDASRGIEWIRSAAELLLKNPTPFAMMGLILAVIGFVPLLGAFAILILGPTLYGGLVFAAARQERGEAIEVGNLFEAFRQEGKVGRMVMLCLPNVALLLVVMVLAVVALVGFGLAAAFTAAANSGEMPSIQALLASVGVGGLMMFALILIPLALAVAALLFLSISRVMLQDVEPFAAMKQSFKACLDNAGAFLIAIISIGLLRLLIMMLIGTVSGVLGALIVGVVVEPLLAVTGYKAFRDLYGDTAELESQSGAASASSGSMSAEL
jgi:hypothetical protein